MTFGSVYCKSLRGLYSGIPCLYLWYNLLVMFQMVGWEAQGCGLDLASSDVVSVANIISFQGW